jgi:hypothetical protein
VILSFIRILLKRISFLFGGRNSTIGKLMYAGPIQTSIGSIWKLLAYYKAIRRKLRAHGPWSNFKSSQPMTYCKQGLRGPAKSSRDLPTNRPNLASSGTSTSPLLSTIFVFSTSFFSRTYQSMYFIKRKAIRSLQILIGRGY